MIQGTSFSNNISMELGVDDSMQPVISRLRFKVRGGKPMKSLDSKENTFSLERKDSRKNSD